MNKVTCQERFHKPAAQESNEVVWDEGRLSLEHCHQQDLLESYKIKIQNIKIQVKSEFVTRINL